MRASAAGIIRRAVEAAVKDGRIKAASVPDIIIEKPKKEEFGDFSTNIAMLLSPLEKRPPREIANILVPLVADEPLVSKCEVAGPGFINVFLKRSYWYSALQDILRNGGPFARIDAGKGKKVQIEFVSANPTGPLHIGHGRGAAVGDSLARVMKAAGYEVQKEFYINDVGRQVKTLGDSVRLRIRELQGEKIEMPQDSYRGDYVKDIAAAYSEKYPESAKGAPAMQDFACNMMLDKIRADLKDFGVEFDGWYSEKTLYASNKVDSTIEELKKRGFIYESEGALWFRTTDFGDDKDRVLKKADGSMTYFASDVAYHREKMGRGFDGLVDIWGADHHGYEARVRAVLKAFGYDDKALNIIFIQLVALLRAGVPVPMGKREGEFVTLRQVMDEVGKDACRFFFLMRRSDAQLDFDLELAKSQAPENPVYYVQYCHARIQSIIAFAREKGVEADVTKDLDMRVLEKLDLSEEIAIIKHLAMFDEVVERSAALMEPHRVAFYLMELAGLFHPYYNRNRVVTDDERLTKARLFLCRAVGSVAAAGLGLIGVSAPEKM